MSGDVRSTNNAQDGDAAQRGPGMPTRPRLPSGWDTVCALQARDTCHSIPNTHSSACFKSLGRERITVSINRASTEKMFGKGKAVPFLVCNDLEHVLGNRNNLQAGRAVQCHTNQYQDIEK